jgi:hypothetical protein
MLIKALKDFSLSINGRQVSLSSGQVFEVLQQDISFFNSCLADGLCEKVENKKELPPSSMTSVSASVVPDPIKGVKEPTVSVYVSVAPQTVTSNSAGVIVKTFDASTFPAVSKKGKGFFGRLFGK